MHRSTSLIGDNLTSRATWRQAKRTGVDGIVATLLANAIDTLNGVHADRWGLTQFRGGNLRLNAGYCEAMTLNPGVVDLLVVEDDAIRALKGRGVEIQRRGVLSSSSGFRAA